MVDSRHLNTSLITTKADQLITTTTQTGNNFIIPLIAARPHRATGRSARQLGIISLYEISRSWLHVNATLHVDVIRRYSRGFRLVSKVSNQSTVHRNLTP